MTLRVVDLEAGYGVNVVVKGVTAEFKPGEVSAVIGPNGAGKSTLLKCIAGVIKPRRGRITLGDVDLSKLPEVERARLVGYLPQRIPLIFPVTVYEAVLLGRLPHFNATPKKADLDAVEGALRELDLLDMAARYVNELSGGQAQRVHLARLLAQDPKVFLLDEPEANLDLKYQLEVLEKVRHITKRDGRITIMAIHDLNLALKFADRVFVMYNGEIIASGEPHEVINEKLIAKVYGVDAHVVKTPRGIRVLV